MNQPHITISEKVGSECHHTITNTCCIYYSKPTDDIRVSSWLAYRQAVISPTPRGGYRTKNIQYNKKNKVYRTKTDTRRRGQSAVTMLCEHASDMRDNPDSLTTEFMMDLIEGFKREPVDR